MGINDGVLVYCYLAEIQLRGTDRLPMNARSLTATGRRHNEGVVRWNNILRNNTLGDSPGRDEL